jgi:general secretion pathway protein C
MNIHEIISNPRIRQWLPGILNGSVLLLLTASLAHWTWLIAKPPLPTVMLTPPPPVTAPQDIFSLQPLLAANLFGQASPEASAGRSDSLPISSLNLVLTGIIASPHGGHVLISVNGQPQEAFSIGQIITGGAVLRAVYPDRAVIERNGTRESLILEGADKSSAGQWAPNAAISRPAAAPANAIREVDANHYVVNRAQITSQMRAPDFLRQASVIPSPGGGFKIQQIQPGSLYEKMGLHPGDIVKVVNGQPINSADDAMRIYQQMQGNAAIQIEISRNGKPDTLHYQFAQN